MESRWLALIPALKKVEERWDQSKQYFMEFLTSKKDFKKTTYQNPRYQRIVAFFRKEKLTLVQLAFTIDVSVPFVNFLTVFSDTCLYYLQGSERFSENSNEKIFEGQSY